MTIRMSYEMRRAQNEEMFHPRVVSGDHRQVKRQMRRMLDRAVRCAIASSLYVDWALVVEYRQLVNRPEHLAKANKARSSMRRMITGSLVVPTAGGNSISLKTYS